jgi:hypothetical protein
LARPPWHSARSGSCPRPIRRRPSPHPSRARSPCGRDRALMSRIGHSVWEGRRRDDDRIRRGAVGLGGCERPGAVPGQPTELDRGGGTADGRVGHRESGSNRRLGDRLPGDDRHLHAGLSLSGPGAGRRPGAAAGRRFTAWLRATGSGQRAGMRILRADRRTQTSLAGVAPARDDFRSRVDQPRGRGPRRGLSYAWTGPFGCLPKTTFV